MANRKITDLAALTAPATGDLLPIVDISEAAAADKNKKITFGELLSSAPDGSAAAPSFSFDSDPNTGIYSPGADQVAISTGGSGRLFVDASGNIVINGSASSGGFAFSQIVPVSGSPVNSFRVTNGSDATYDVKLQSGLATIGAGVGSLAFITNDVERIRLDTSGRVGIGTSSVSERFEIGTTSPGLSDAVNLRINAGNSGGTSLRFYGGGNTSLKEVAKIKIYASSATEEGNLGFFTASNDGANNLTLSQKLTILASGNVGIGVTVPLNPLHLVGSSRFNVSGSNHLLITAEGGAPYLQVEQNASLHFGTNSQLRATIDSSGRLLVGTSSARTSGLGSGISLLVEGAPDTINIGTVRNSNNASSAKFVLAKTRGSAVGSNTAVQSGDSIGVLEFDGADGTQLLCGASIEALVDGTPGANDMPGRLVFSTTADGAASPTERMRIDSAGQVLIATTSTALSDEGLIIYTNGEVNARRDTDGALYAFNRSGSTVGSITVSTSATAFNTSSDYRLKENVTTVTDGITRLQQLKPSRFNFIADPDHTVDGFIAHEAQAVVPECVTGEKDAVDDDGNPVYQGIDQSKLVPLLTAALQEAIGEIESLKARVVALEGA
jgi:hypothetical protein